MPNGFSGPSPMVSTTVEQFGLVTICPFQPRRACWRGTSCRWSGIDLRHQQRHVGLHAVVLASWRPRRGRPAAKACSISVATEASIAEKTSRGALPGLHSSTVRSATDAGSAAAQVPLRGVAVLLARRAVARAQPRQVEPGMVLQKLDEMLAHHSGGAEDADFDSLRCIILPNLSNCHVVDKFAPLREVAALGTRSSSVCATWMEPGPSRNGLAPGAAERRDVGGVRPPRSFRIRRSAPSRTAGMHRTSRTSARPAAACWTTAARGVAGSPTSRIMILGAARRSAITFGARPPAMRADVQRARPEQRIDGQRDARGSRRARRAACRWPIRPVPGRPSAPCCPAATIS